MNQPNRHHYTAFPIPTYHCIPMIRRLLAALLTTTGLYLILLLGMAMVGQSTAATALTMPVAAPVTGFAACNEPASAAPYLDIVPSLDGAELFVRLVGEGKIGDTAFSTVYVGGTGHMLSWTDTISENVVTAVVPGVTPGVSISGTVFITLTAPFFTQQVQFYRAYLPLPNNQTVSSPDGQLTLALVSTDTFTTNTYLLVMPSFGPPGALPPDHCPLSATYNVRAAGGLAAANRPLNLRFYVDALTIGDLPHPTLTVLGWNEAAQRWEERGGQYNALNGYVALATPRLTTYVLVSAPRWLDEFENLNGLVLTQTMNVSLAGAPQQRALTLDAFSTNGFATSQVFTPTVADAAWATLLYSATTNPPTTTLTVDLLDASGALVQADLPSGAALDGLDRQRYPALQLRVSLTSTILGETPRLERWRLGWRSKAATPTPTPTATATPTATPSPTPTSTATPYYTNHLPLVKNE